MQRVRMVLLATAVAGLAGCGSDASTVDPGSSGHMWAAGQSGLMVAAFDGVTLVEQPAVTGAALRALMFVDDQLAWAVGDGGTILATRNGGASWSPTGVEGVGALRAVAFADAGRGYAVGDGGVVLRTTDAGATWARLPAPATVSLRGVAAAPSGGLVLAVGEGGAVLRSVDGGEHFEGVPAPTTQILRAVRMADDELRVLAVGDGGTVIASDDAGRTWRAESAAPADLTNVALGSDGATAVGKGGLIWRRPDGATVWTAVPSGTASDLGAVKFDRAAPSWGWVVGGAGTVLYTNDGGAHFRPLATSLRGDLNAVEDF